MYELSQLSCVLLCGGKSSRMGEDKSLLKLGSKNLTQRSVAKLKPLFKQVFVSAKEDKFNQEFALIRDDENYEIYSPMLALYSVLKHFKNEFVFVLCVDYPKFGQSELQYLLSFLKQDYKAVIAKSPSHTHFLCGFYHSSLAMKCKELLDKKEQKISNLLAQIHYKSVEFQSDEAFLNLNFYADFEKFKKEFQ